MTTDEGELAYLQTGIQFLRNTWATLKKTSAAYEALRADPTLTPSARTLKVVGAADKAQHGAIETITKQIAHNQAQ